MNPAEMIKALRDVGVPQSQIDTALGILRRQKRRDALGNSPDDRVARYRKKRRSTEWEWRVIRTATLKRDGERCHYCAQQAGPFVVDHVIPVSKGGTEDPSNLVVACRPCNASKRDRPLEEWRGRCP